MFDRSKFITPDLTSPPPPWEYHAHTLYSDGSATMAEMINVAIEKGIQRLIFTEHTEPELAGPAGWFRRYADELYALRRQFDGMIELVLGLEVPALDFHGSLPLTEEMSQEAEFILAAVHAFPNEGWSFGHLTANQAIDIEYKTLIGLAKNPLVDAIAHPGGICSAYVTPFPMDLFEEIAALAASNDIAIELNPAYQNPMLPYLQACRRQGALLSPGSNAHHPPQIGTAWQCLGELVGLP